MLVISNISLKNLLNEKARDRNAQTSSPYNRTGNHRLLSSSRMTSSDANLPTLAKIPFADRQNERFACSKQHLNFADRTINITRNLISSAQNSSGQ